MSSALHDDFVRLCETPSPTGSEREVASLVRLSLESAGHEVAEDGAAEATGCDSGNLVCRIPGRSERWILLGAHLDTVPHEGPIGVSLDGGVFRSRGDTILGADNKAAVAVLLEAARRWGREQPAVGVELAFTVAEETGLRGAHALERGSLRAEMGFVFDHASPIGEVVMAAPTYHRVVAEFRGVESHAGVAPERGRNAISAAALAVSEMKIGRLDAETTANVGVIAGGTATNVVPGLCTVDFEARSLSDDRAGEVATALIEACNWGAGRAECDVDVEVTTQFRAYRLRPADAPPTVAMAALRSCGFEPAGVDSGGGSDANAFNSGGLPSVNLANGTFANHTSDEHVPAANLDAMVDVALAIAEEAARC